MKTERQWLCQSCWVSHPEQSHLSKARPRCSPCPSSNVVLATCELTEGALLGRLKEQPNGLAGTWGPVSHFPKRGVIYREELRVVLLFRWQTGDFSLCEGSVSAPVVPSVQNSSDYTLLGRAQAGWPPSFRGNSRSLSQQCSSLWLASNHLPASCAAVMPSGEGCSEAGPTEVVCTSAAFLAASRRRQSRAPGSCGRCGAASSCGWVLDAHSEQRLVPHSSGLMLYLQVLPACASSSVLLLKAHLRFPLPTVAAVDISKSNSLQCWAPLKNKEYWTYLFHPVFWPLLCPRSARWKTGGGLRWLCARSPRWSGRVQQGNS